MVAKKTIRPTDAAKSTVRSIKSAKSGKAVPGIDPLALAQEVAPSPAAAADPAPAARPRSTVKVDVARSAVKQVKVVETDLVLVLDDGRTVYVRDGAVQSMIDRDFAVEFSDGVVSGGQDLLHLAGDVPISPVSVTTTGESLSGAVVTDAPTSPGAAPTPEKSGGKWQTYALIGAPLIGGAMAGALSKGSGSNSSTTTQSTGTGGTQVATKTAMPIIQPINGNNLINAAQKTAGVTVTGTAEANSTVTVTFGNSQKTATANASGVWTVTYAAADLPADAQQVTIAATAKSPTATASDPVMRDVRIDTVGPDAPRINPVTGDNALNPAEQQAPVTLNGVAEANATVKVDWAGVTKLVVADGAGVWNATYSVAELPKTVGTSTVTVTATDSAGNAGSPATQDVVVSPAVEIAGTVAAGRMLSGNGLVVSIYSADGRTLLAANVKVGANGSFSASNLAVANGAAVVAVVTDTNDAADYLDEATGLGKSLGTARLLAAGIVNGASVTLNINPLTTAAAQKAGLSEDGSGSVTAARVSTANVDVAKALGLGSVDITQITPAVTNGGSYNPADGLSNAEKAGALLAALSGNDLLNGGSIGTTIANLVAQVGNGTLTEQGQTQLVAGAVKAAPQVAGSLQSVVADAAAQTSAAAQFTMAPVAQDNVINAGEVSGLTLTGTVASGATAVRLRFGTSVQSATVANGTWTYAVTAADLAALGGDGVRVISAEATLAGGATATASRPVTLATARPAAPLIDPVSGDTWINAVEATRAVDITGTGTAGTVVSVTWGTGPAKSATVDSSGRWTVSYQPAEIPATATSRVAAVIIDQFGNRSDAQEVTANYNVTTPAMPTINPINSTNTVGISAGKTGVQLSGTGTGGGTVILNWGTRYRDQVVAVDPATNTWKVIVPVASLPDNGLVPLTVVQKDTAGNTSQAARLDVTVAVTAPPAPISINTVALDNYVNATEAGNGFQVRGKATPGQTVFVQIGNYTAKSAVVGASGDWTVTFTPTGSGIPADGSYTLKAYARDADGNQSDDLTYGFPVVVDAVVNTPTITTVAGDAKTAARVNFIEARDGFTITGQSDADAARIEVVLTNVANPSQQISTIARVGANGVWTASLPGGSGLSDGAWTAKVTFTDRAGNVAESEAVPVQVDTAVPGAPTIDLTGATLNVGADARNTGVFLTGTGEQGASVVVEWRLANGQVAYSSQTAGRTIVVSPQGTWSLNIDGADLPPDQTYTAVVTQTDLAGNQSQALGFGVVVKTNAIANPTISTFGDRLLDGVTYVGQPDLNKAITVKGKAPLGSVGLTVTVTWNGQSATGTVDQDNSWTATFAAGSFAGVVPGTTSARAVLTDSFGNSSGAAQFPVTLDTQVPVPVLASSITADNIINIAERDGGFDVSFTAASDVASGSVTIGALTQLAQATTVNGVTTWTARFNSLSGVGPVNANGTLNVTATVTDKAGNTATTAVRTLATDFNAPPAPTVNPVSQGYLNAAEVAQDLLVTGTGTAGARVDVWLGSTRVSTTVNNAGNWQATLPASALTNLAGGSQTVRAVEYDSVLNVSEVGQANVIVDKSVDAPIIQGVVTSPATGALGAVVNYALTKSGVVIKGTAEIGAMVNVRWGTWQTSDGQVIADAQGNWQVTVPEGLVPADGAAVPITATAKDPAGNLSVASPAFNVRIDTTADLPAMTLLNSTAVAASAPLYVNAATPTTRALAASGTVEAGSTVTLVLVRPDGTRTTIGTPGGTSSGTWSQSIPANLTAVDGTYSIVLSMVDAVGNPSGEQSYSFIVDRTRPSAIDASLVTVAGDNVVSVAERYAGVDVTGRAEANATVRVTWNSVVKTVKADATGAWKATYAPLEIPAATADGTPASLTVLQTDVAGNAAASATTVNFTLQAGNSAAPQINPTIAGDNIVSGQERVNPLTISGAVTNGTDQVQVKISPTGTTQGADLTFTATVNQTNKTWTVTLSPEQMATLNGTYKVTAVATNVTGQPASPPVDISFVAAAKTPSINPIAHNDVISVPDRDGGVTVTGTAGSADDTIVVQLFSGTTLRATATATVAADGTYRALFSAAVLQGLPDSSSLTFTATASLGGISSEAKSRVVTTDYHVPELQGFTSDTASGIYNAGRTINITANFNEVVKQGSTMTITLNTGQSVVLTAATNGQTLTGTYVVGAGQNSSAALTVTGISARSVANLLDNALPASAAVPTANLSGQRIFIDTTPNGALLNALLYPSDGVVTGSITATSTAVTASTTSEVLRFKIPSLIGNFVAGDRIEVVEIDGAGASRVVASYTVPQSLLNPINGGWTGPSMLVLTPNAPIPAGSHTFAVRVVDLAGNVSANSATPLTVLVDQTGPVIDLNGAAAGRDNVVTMVPGTALALADGAATIADALGSEAPGAGSGVAQIRIQATALGKGSLKELLSLAGVTDLRVNGAAAADGWNADGSGVTTITFTLGGQAWRGTYSAATQTFAFTPQSGTSSSATAVVITTAQAQALLAALRYTDPNTTLNEGARTFTVSAVDGAGNVSATSTATLVVDNARPTVSAVVPRGNVDANGDRQAESFRIAFSEAVQVAAVTALANWTGADRLGTGATLVAVDPITINGVVYATTFQVIPGAGATIAAGDSLTLAAAAAVGLGGAGDVAAADLAFTVPALSIGISGGNGQYFRPLLFGGAGGEGSGPWNYLNAAERALSVTAGLVDITLQTPGLARYYINGIELANKLIAMPSGGSRWATSLSGNDWGVDGVKLASVRFEDANGNLSRFYENRKIMVDTALRGITAIEVTTDGGVAGAADQNDVVTITFAEPVTLTANSLPAAFGTGATLTPVVGYTTPSGLTSNIRPVGTSEPYATVWQVTLGANPTLAGGQALTFGSTDAPVADMAGNRSTALAFTTPANLFDRPGTPVIGNVTSDNVINGTENAAAQAVTINLSGAKVGDVVTLFRDGVQVGQTTVAQNGLPQVSIVMAAGSWGADGEHALTASIQRGAAGTAVTSAVRSVYVAAEGSHWSALIPNTIWFDPDTLLLTEGSSVSTWNASVGTTKAGGALSLVAKAGTTPVLFSRDTLGHVQLYFGGAGSTGSALISNADVTLPTLQAGFANFSMAKQLGTGSNVLSSYVAVPGVGRGAITALMGSSGDAYTTGYNMYDFTTLNGVSLGSTQPRATLNLWRAEAMVGDGTTVGFQVDALNWWDTALPNSTFNATAPQALSNLQVGWNGTVSFQGMVGDQILFGSAISKAMAEEVNVYLAVKYGSLGSVVPVTARVQTYDLSSPGGNPSLIDQVLQLGQTTLGTGNDTAIVAGADFVNMGAGNDTVRLIDLNFRTIDGGLGFDTLVLDARYTNAASGSVFNLSDYVGNARGMDDQFGTAADDARVNANGFHKLQGIERLDFRQETEAQTIRLTFADVDQMAEKNLAGDPQAQAGRSNLYLILGANDRLDASALGRVEYGYWQDATGQVYDRRYLSQGLTDQASVYVQGGLERIDIVPELGAISRSDTAVSLLLDQAIVPLSADGAGWTARVGSSSATVNGLTLDNVAGHGVLKLAGTGFGTAGTLELSYTGSAVAMANGVELGWKSIAIGSEAADTINLSSRTAGQAILGMGGNDTIIGSSAGDLIVGGFGNDVLTGGGGADLFRVAENDTGVDTITDFTWVQGDKLDLSALLARVPVQTTTLADGSIAAVNVLKLVATGANEATLMVDTGLSGNFVADTIPYAIKLQGMAVTTLAGGEVQFGGKTLAELINQQTVIIG